jgi:hypothetical protein
MTKEWQTVNLNYERLMQIEEGTFTVKMFNMDGVVATQAEYDRAAEIDALNEALDQNSIMLNVIGNSLENNER